MKKTIKNKIIDDKNKKNNSKRIEDLQKELSMPTAPKFGIAQREQELAYLAMLEAERRIRNGTVSSQVLVHYLDLASTKSENETKRAELELELLQAKTDLIRATSRRQEQLDSVIEMLRKYRGHDEVLERHDLADDVQ